MQIGLHFLISNEENPNPICVGDLKKQNSARGGVLLLATHHSESNELNMTNVIRIYEEWNLREKLKSL